ncbi:Uncharacterised protein [Zhongshania aliphaticivorans]|uniref:Lipoprotein n=1 Tax=Zhongshania aliphaticivorans TaxID=1470434 RepID=A0A5S9NHK9_9GAMM|nr:DUF3299 domain-containing protein [Zhongshania aliphaticivorans]CAA0090017.1 Uncharacterised protein [Zhongshania aliphaticivorans]CAA0097237.1 Uncharacterised protein [Zhongshania aliphaticivorans]
MAHRCWYCLKRYIVPFALILMSVYSVQGQAEGVQKSESYLDIEWTDLMPKDDLDAILNPPEYLDDIVDGSVEDQLSELGQLSLPEADDSRYQQALVSSRVVEEFDGKAIRLPGFIVPLAFGSSQQEVTRFFLVPYFGACIHVPPPPPNQIIYAEFDKGFKLESLYDPFFLSGVLSTTMVEHETATAAYVIKVEKIEPYSE